MKRSFLLTLFCFASLGCASSGGNSPSFPPEPEGASEPAASPAKTTGSDKTHIWTLAPTDQSEAYRSVIKTKLEETNTPEKRRSEFTTSADYSYKLQHSSKQIEIAGSVSAFQVVDDQTTSSSMPVSLTTPLLFEGRITDHNISLRPLSSNPLVSSAPCGDSVQTTLSTISRDLVILPQEISGNQSWQDSTSNTVCNGSVPVVVSTIRNYRIIGETVANGVAALKLEMTEKILASGEGSQGQHQISITGTGTGTSQIYVDRISGTLLSLTGRNQIELSIRSSGRVQTFSQISDKNTVRKPAP